MHLEILSYLCFLSIILVSIVNPGSLRGSISLYRNMDFRSSTPFLLLLFCLGTLLCVRGQRGYLKEALRALDLPLGTEEEPRLHKNDTGVLITTLLQAVQCGEWTGTTQDTCNKVHPSLDYRTSATTWPESCCVCVHLVLPACSRIKLWLIECGELGPSPQHPCWVPVDMPQYDVINFM